MNSLLVYVPGSRWTDVAGTDRRLVTAVAESVPVLWVDPPFSPATRQRTAEETPRAGIDEVAPGVSRLQILAPPGASRPGIRLLTRFLRQRAIRRAVDRLGQTPIAVIVASPRERMPRHVAGVRMLYCTDDWLAGAGLMGLSPSHVRDTMRANVSDADIIAAVSPTLAQRLAKEFSAEVEVLANGCTVPISTVSGVSSGSSAVLVGQLNERIDTSLLEAVRDAGVAIDVIGPRSERLAATTAALDELLRSPGITWRGEMPQEELPAMLSQMAVGLTPYADTEFNRASFPLKTLDYLASGLPVVSTDLPSVAWLDTDLIEVASGPVDFAEKVVEVLARPRTSDDRDRRIAFARTHSWHARADQLLRLLTSQQR
jgi:teichuronic acid biosynthesis glycosyltransferase TuaH